MSKIFRKKKENLVSVLNALIKDLNIPVSSHTIKHSLLGHPQYPSLMALSDCLNTWNIEHEAFRAEKSEFVVEESSFPFIAHYKSSGGRFVLIHKLNNGKLEYSDEKFNNKKISIPEFINLWDGVVLLAKKNDQSGESDYKNKLFEGFLNSSRIPFLITVLLSSILLSLNYNNTNPITLVLLGTKIAGIVTSILLLIHSIDSNNPFVQSLCSLGNKGGCNAILKSDAAKVTNWLSWSEVGMFYFSGSFICLLLNPHSLLLLSWLNLLCLPYTIYSISYQIKSKSWCVLCCSVQMLLWVEAMIYNIHIHFIYNLSDIKITSGTFLSFFLCFLVPVALWSFIKPFMHDSNQLIPLKEQLKKFKSNNRVFNQLLANQPRYAVPEDLMPVTFGNKNSKTTITMISGPLCNPCAKAHKTLETWLNHGIDIQLKIIFTIPDQEDDTRTKFARHMVALGLERNNDVTENALNDWYIQKNKDYEKWANKYPVHQNDEIKYLSLKQKEWYRMVGVTFTPTFLINGHKLMDSYNLEDIKYLIS